MSLPVRVAITPGEPGGIGPDLLVMAAQGVLPAALVAIADPDMLEARAQRLGLTLTCLADDGDCTPLPAGQLRVLPVPLPTAAIPGKAQPAHAHALLTTLRLATEGCLRGAFDALVTGPIQKSSINAAGIPFTGHTEFLAEISHTPRVVMMLATEGLRVALVTTHLPLREVADAITPTLLDEVISITEGSLRSGFGIASPRLLVCGLNPHAGEGGHLGREEIDVILPVLERLRARGLTLEGPLPADTLFTPDRLARCDAVIAMYHDQGLPVLKHKGFGNAVNITLGLPFIRTSVDHGTALDLAGSGRIDTGSFHTALTTAITMAHRRKESPHGT